MSPREERRRDPGSVVERDAVVVGRLSGAGPLVVRGRVAGSIQLDGDLSVEAGAVVKADVDATNVAIAGVVLGDIRAAGRVVVHESGRVRGRIEAAALVLVAGGRIEGDVVRSGEARPRPHRPEARERPIEARPPEPARVEARPPEPSRVEARPPEPARVEARPPEPLPPRPPRVLVEEASESAVAAPKRRRLVLKLRGAPDSEP